MTYMEAISKGFPGVHCHSQGLDDTYDSIVWDAGNALPSKQTLDEYIAVNAGNASSGTRVTVLAFRNRFTMDEKIATELAAVDNPSAAMAARQLAAAVRVLSRDTESATFIDLSRTDTRNGVMMLEQYGIIGAGRALAILDSPVTDVERSPI